MAVFAIDRATVDQDPAADPCTHGQQNHVVHPAAAPPPILAVSSRPGIVRFEVNRPLSGMGHERWVAGQPIEGQRPVDELARRIFARGGIDSVHINGSVVTVQLARGSEASGIDEVITHLFRFYPDGEAVAATAAPPPAEAEAPAPTE